MLKVAEATDNHRNLPALLGQPAEAPPYDGGIDPKGRSVAQYRSMRFGNPL